MVRFKSPIEDCGVNMTDIEDIIQRQVNAYNGRDIDRFVEFFADTIELYDFPDRLILKGKEALRERYTKRFSASVDLKAVILKRFSTQKYVVDIEDLIGSDFGSAPATVIYEVENELIQKAWFVRDATI